MASLLKRITATVTCFLFTYAILLPAWGDAVTQSAADGNQAAVNALESFKVPSFDSESGEILFGASGQTSNIRAQDIFPGATDINSSELQDSFGDDEKTLRGGNLANQTLADEESMNGEAYRVLKGSAGMTRPNIQNDPIWNVTDEVFSNQDVFEKEFSDCSERTEVTQTVLKKHVPEYKTCEKVNKPAGNCEINHYVDIKSAPVDIFFLVDNSSSMGSALAALRVNANKFAGLLGVDNEGDLRIGGAITRGSKYITNHVKLNSDITVFQNWIDSVGIDGGETYTFPATFWAVANNDWRENVEKVIVIIGNEDQGHGVSPATMLAAQGFTVYVFHNVGEIKALGTHISNTFTAGGLFKVAQFLTVVQDRWEPADCIQAAKSTKDGFCTGSYEAVTGDTECVNLSGFDVCPGDPIYGKIGEPPLPDISKLALKVKVGQVECPFNEGTMACYTDANGVEQCPENSDKVCGVNHTLNLREVPLTVNVAVEDTIEVYENHQVAIDFVAGTVTRTNQLGHNIVGNVTQASYEYLCGGGAPTKFVMSSVSVWDSHPYAPKTLPLANVTVAQAPSCENGLKAIVNITDHNVGELGWYFAHTLKFQGVQLLKESWGPENCLAAAKKHTDGQCSEGGLTVTKGVASGCLTLSGVQVCPGDSFYEAMLPSPISGIDKLALQVRVEGCVENGLRSSTCDDFEKDPTCGFISQKCVGGADGASGYCYVEEQVWDCGHDVEVPSATLDTSYQCDGPVRCMGTECYNPVDEKSTDFAYVSAALQVAQFAESDLFCGDEPEGNLDCLVWKGEHLECKKAVGGWVDCCESPDGVSLMDYVNLTMNTLNTANIISNFDGMSPKSSLYSYGADLAAQGWQAVSTAWSNALSSTVADTGMKAAEKFVMEEVINQFKQKVMDMAAQWTLDTFGAGAANAIFASGSVAEGASNTPYATTNPATGATTAGAGGTGGATFATNFMMAMNVVMMAYMIYQIANILVQIIWECEEAEFTLGAKKETKVCHFVGSYCADETPFGCIEKRESYCCFNSPVGRIIHEQARPLMGQGWEWGEPENPNCGGFTLEQIKDIPWDKIDLSEWIGILNMAGHYPTINNVSLDDITGQGNILNMDGDRMDTAERNVERVDGVDVEEARKAAEDDLRSGLFK